jgi:hypothetical protein
MDALRTAVPLARLFLALSDARSPAQVRVRCGTRRASVRLESGTLLCVDGVDSEPLGDALLRHGRLDQAKHSAGLSERPQVGRVGPWLVAVGAASEAAVTNALELQLEARLGQLLRWPEASFELVRSDGPYAPTLDEGPAPRADLRRAVWRGLLALCTELPPARVAALSGDTALRLTKSGSRLVEALERTAARDTPTSVEVSIARWLAPAPDRSAGAPRAVLRVLGAAVDASFDGDACRLLLRKQREIRRRVGARALLDLPPQARSEQARPALRRLAQKLHPDRFHGVEPALCAASHEVMRALSQAEGELLASTYRVR